MIDPEFWAGRSVLVTGHTGFKGGWLSAWLAQMGAEVTGYSAYDPVSQPALFDQAAIGAAIARDQRGDIRDLPRAISVVAECHPSVVFHLAAQPIVRRAFEQPLETFDINVAGTCTLLDALRARELLDCAIVVVTSDKVYANSEAGRPFREDDPLGGHDPYSASKAAQELVAAAYRDSLGFGRLATARAGNVIGGGDWAEARLVPDAMRAALSGEPLHVRSPDSVRPWQHVLNPLSGYILLAQRLAASDDPAAGRFACPWNFGPEVDDSLPVRDIVSRLTSLWPGLQVTVADAASVDRREAQVLRVDSTRARSKLGWRPVWGLEEGLAATVEWTRADDARAATLAQIERFAAAAVAGAS